MVNQAILTNETGTGTGFHEDFLGDQRIIYTTNHPLIPTPDEQEAINIQGGASGCAVKTCPFAPGRRLDKWYKDSAGSLVCPLHSDLYGLLRAIGTVVPKRGVPCLDTP
jgi:hypothetical protein